MNADQKKAGGKRISSIPISVVIITKNEEERLAECLESVSWAKEIVVIDDESSDQTTGVARRYTDKIFIRRMAVEGEQRNFAIDQASCEWILSLDADERVSSGLAAEIERIVTENNTHFSGYAIPVKTFIGKRWIKGARYYPATKLRLFRNGKFRYEEAQVHPRVFLNGKRGFLKGDIIHYGFQNFWHFVDKLNRQTTLEAEKWILDGRKVTMLNSFRKTMDRFLRNYILKNGWKDGFLGFIMSAFHGLYQLFSYAKYWELTRGKEVVR